MADLATVLMGAAGAAGGDKLYVEDVFSTYLYTGNGSTQTITNGIDLDGEGGLVWIKCRPTGRAHGLYDTVRGDLNKIVSNDSNAQESQANSVTAFNSNGFSVGSYANVNQSGESFASWTFRKAPKFFDCVTWTGTGANRTVAHNLGSVPGCIIVKRTDTTGDWQVYHRANTAAPETDYLVLNTTAATADSNTRWNDTAPTDAVFSLGTEATVNASGGTYVAYLFAHDAGGFGDDGSENVISCGSYTGNGSSGLAVTLGYEPQWVMVKCSSANQADGWIMVDTMRGFDNSANQWLQAQSSNAESAESARIIPTATGFTLSSNAAVNTNAATYIYIAIRRGPMKTPTAGTEVYTANAYTGTGAAATKTTGFPVDLVIGQRRENISGHVFIDRLRGRASVLASTSTSAEVTSGSTNDLTGFDVSDGYKVQTPSNSWINNDGSSCLDYAFRRAPGFFDVVCYTGTGANRTVAHNLGVVPELMIVKNRSQADAWAVYAGDNTDYLVLNTTAATADLNTYWNDTSPTSTNFTVGTVHNTNASAENYVAYLFASLAGVSDIGTYTGNGTSVTVTTGFQPRFILVKRTSSTGNWIVGDSARGFVAGNDPFLLLNTTDAETTNQDWVDVSATGFTVNETAANANVNTGVYLYLAIS